MLGSPIRSEARKRSGISCAAAGPARDKNASEKDACGLQDLCYEAKRVFGAGFLIFLLLNEFYRSNYI